MKRVAILQSNYIPWKGYFDLIASVDEFVFYDVAQYTKNDWRNRNKIKTPNGMQWLTIPVKQERLEQTILETRISDNKWNIKHWKSISNAYSKAKFFKEYRDAFEQLYLSSHELCLSRINYKFIQLINTLLGVKTQLSFADDYVLVNGKNERLVDLCRKLEATHYISGPAAQAYLDEGLFRSEGICVEWMDYSEYPEYEQLHPPFEHAVSVIDLIFNQGPDSAKYMKNL